MSACPRRDAAEQGYAMAALLVGLSVMAVVLSVALPAWQTVARREREAELVFRGEQYARAVALFQRSRGAFPPSIDVLVTERFLRKKYLDPMSPDGQFQVIYVGQVLPGEVAAGEARPGRAPTTRGSLETLAQQTGGVPGQSGFGQAGGTAGAVLGVVSKSTQTSLRQYNGRGKYNEWAFVAVQATQQGGAGAGPGAQRGVGQPPGGLGRGGRDGRGPSGPGGGAGGQRGGAQPGGRLGLPPRGNLR